MKRTALTIAAVLAAWTLTAATVRTATESFVTNHIALAMQSATNYTDSIASTKQDTITDLAAIRSGAALGATALQSYTESDPVWSAEKSGYATIRALAEGDIVPNRADKANYANLAGFASNAAELGDRSATAILGQLDDQTAQLSSLESRVSAASRASTNYTDSTAATLRDSIEDKADATNTYTKAQMDAALAGKVPTSRTVNGKALSSDVTIVDTDIPYTGYGSGYYSTVGAGLDACSQVMASLPSPSDILYTDSSGNVAKNNQAVDGLTIDFHPVAKLQGAEVRVPNTIVVFNSDGDLTSSGKSAADFAAAGDLAAAAVAATNYTDSATNAIPKFSEKDVVKVYFRDGENYPSYVDGRGELWEIGDLELGGHWVATGGPASSQGTYNYAGHTGGVYGWTLEGNYITYDTSTGVIVHNGSTSTNTPEPGKNPEVIGTTFPTCHNIWASGRTITYYPMAYQYDSKGRFALSNALSKVAFTGNYNDLTGKPTFATVATSGSYNDLTDKPSIPSPTAPVASATLAWQSNGSAIVVSVGAAGTLSATLTDWIEGQTQTALITLAAGAQVSSEVKLVGYGTWPTGGQFLASATRVGNFVYVTPIVLVN